MRPKILSGLIGLMCAMVLFLSMQYRMIAIQCIKFGCEEPSKLSIYRNKTMVLNEDFYSRIYDFKVVSNHNFFLLYQSADSVSSNTTYTNLGLYFMDSKYLSILKKVEKMDGMLVSISNPYTDNCLFVSWTQVVEMLPDYSKLNFAHYVSGRHTNTIQYVDITATSDPTYNVQGQITGTEPEEFKTMISSSSPHPVSILSYQTRVQPLQAALYALVSNPLSLKIFKFMSDSGEVTSKFVLIPAIEGKSSPSLTHIGKKFPFKVDRKGYAYIILKLYKEEQLAFENYHQLPHDTYLQFPTASDSFVDVLIIVDMNVNPGALKSIKQVFPFVGIPTTMQLYLQNIDMLSNGNIMTIAGYSKLGKETTASATYGYINIEANITDPTVSVKELNIPDVQESQVNDVHFVIPENRTDYISLVAGSYGTLKKGSSYIAALEMLSTMPFFIQKFPTIEEATGERFEIIQETPDGRVLVAGVYETSVEDQLHSFIQEIHTDCIGGGKPEPDTHPKWILPVILAAVVIAGLLFLSILVVMLVRMCCLRYRDEYERIH